MARFLKNLLKVALSLTIVGGAIWLVFNYTALLDWYYLKDYKPTAQIESLATQATMTEEGRKYFYRADPQINQDRTTLAQNCRIEDQETIELGCYLSNNYIYLLEIKQPELEQQMAVTAAHEMLHAVYDRLSVRERNELNAQLREAAANINNPKLQERLKDYGQLEPGEEDNELHSILGTEFGGLPPGLEAHYAKYISNRAQVVALSDQFNKTFDGLRAEISDLDRQIQATRARMEVLKQRNQIDAYNSLVPGINADITIYNSKVDLYNKYASVLMGNDPLAPATQ